MRRGLAGWAPGALLPDTRRSIVVVSRNGELAVALRDSVDVSMAMVRDVRPDEVQNAIAACRPWPWMLVGLRYKPLAFLEAAAAFEASSTPEYDFSVGGLFRLSGAWGTQ